MTLISPSGDSIIYTSPGSRRSPVVILLSFPVVFMAVVF